MLKNLKKYNLVFLVILITALIGGATPVFIKIALKEIDNDRRTLDKKEIMSDVIGFDPNFSSKGLFF